MIKFIGERNGKCLYGFGLSRANCEKLLAGKPIFIDLDDMANAPAPKLRGTVLVFGGETEQDMVNLLNSHGAINDQTEILPLTEDHQGLEE